MKKKILFVYLYCNLGGVTTVIKQRMRALQRADWLVDAVFQKDHGGKQDLIEAGVSSVFIEEDRFKRAVVSLIKKNKYEIVTVIDTPSVLLAFEKSVFKKTIYEIHTSMQYALDKNDERYLQQVATIIVPSNWSKNWILSNYPQLSSDKISVCYNIVDDLNETANQFYSKSIFNQNTILWIGKLNAIKNWKEAIRIVAKPIAEKTATSATFITGGGLDIFSVQAFLEELSFHSLLDKIQWLHNVPYRFMSSIYKECAECGGMLLSTSLSESFSLVVHEALRNGLPVVSTNVGAIPEIIKHGNTGLLYTPGDLQKAQCHIKNLLENSDLRFKLAKGVLQKLSFFEKKIIEEDYLSKLNKLREKIAKRDENE